MGTGVDFRPLDLARAAHFYAIDSLGFLAYSRPLGYLAHDRDMNRAIEITERTLPFMMVLSEYPAVNKLVYRWPLSYLLPREGDKAGFGAIIGCVLSTCILGDMMSISSRVLTWWLLSWCSTASRPS